MTSRIDKGNHLEFEGWEHRWEYKSLDGVRLPFHWGILHYRQRGHGPLDRAGGYSASFVLSRFWVKQDTFLQLAAAYKTNFTFPHVYVGRARTRWRDVLKRVKLRDFGRQYNGDVEFKLDFRSWSIGGYWKLGQEPAAG